MLDTFNRIGAIGDVHLEAELLQLAIDFLKESKVERILCVGDIADGKEDINRCCDILIREKIVTVAGNHDRWLLANDMRRLPDATSLKELNTVTKNFIANLPATFEFVTADGLALLCHGLDKNDMAKVSPDDYGYAIEFNPDLQKIIQAEKYKYIINGHTHKRMVRHFGKTTVINAGTLKREHNPCFAAIDFADKQVSFFEFGDRLEIAQAEVISLSNEQ